MAAGRSPDTRSLPERLPVVLEGDPCRGRQVVVLLDEFHLLIQEEALQEVMEVGSVQTELRTCRSQRAQCRFFSRTLMACRASRFTDTSLILGRLLHVLEVWAAATCICKRHSAASCFSSSNSPKKWSTPSGAMWPLVEIDAPRDVGVGDPEMHVDQALMVASTTVE